MRSDKKSMDDTDYIEIESLHTIEIEREVKQPSDRVWSALTSEKEIETWMEYPTSFEAKLGGKVLINFSEDDPLKGVVCEFEAPKTIAFTWNNSIIRWQLENVKGGTLIKLGHYGVEQQFLVGVAAGWQCFVDNLDNYVNGEKFVDRYERLLKIYRDRFGNVPTQ